MPKILIAFYSRAGENYVNGKIKTLEIGNTELAAKAIAKQTGGELFKIEQTTPYSKDYNKCIEQAKSDQRRSARPELKAYPTGIDDYDVICLGFPNYWGTMPMAVMTFLERFGFSGKTIKPFCTHEGSGMGSSVEDIKKLCPSANVEKGLAVHGGNYSEKEIEKWLKS
ncbi:MAG: flavodoxin [Oscillospiraceae bacterium]|nr:flavodoxin [Oscillospiraceae bacterium]